MEKSLPLMKGIIPRKADWVVRWTFPILFSILGLIALGVWFIRYPNVIRAKATLSGTVAAGDSIILKVHLPSDIRSVLRPGMDVELVPLAWSKKEFGVIAGQLMPATGDTSDVLYWQNIWLPRGFVTSTGRSVQLRVGTPAEAVFYLERNIRLVNQLFRHSVTRGGL
jgi:hypothetical protein